jgi:hypothetical protein
MKTGSITDEVDAEAVRDVEPTRVGLPIEGASATVDYDAKAHQVAKAAMKRKLPQLCAERDRLIRVRSRHPETTGGDALVVDFVRMFGVALALVAGVVVGYAGNSAGGIVAGVAACLIAWVVAAAGASAGVRYTRKLLTRQERERRRAVGKMTRAIRRIDKRIAQARLDFGLTGHAPLPRY